MQLLPLLIRALLSRPVMGLSGLSCPLFRWRPFCTLTAPSSIPSLLSARAIAYPGPESFSFQSDALQLLCVCRGGNMDINMRLRPCRNEVNRKVVRKGAWLSETVNNPCQTRGASVDILSPNFDFSSVFVFPFLHRQKWHF